MVERRFPGHRGPGPELARGRCPAAPGAGGREPDRYVANGRPAVLKARWRARGRNGRRRGAASARWRVVKVHVHSRQDVAEG